MNRLVCLHTGEEYPLTEPRWRSDSGGLLDLEFTPVFDPGRVSNRAPNLWRYREAIPLEDDSNIVTLGEGFTPLLAIEVDGRTVYIKQEHLFPTGSYKDRGGTVLLSKVKELGISHVVEDSSGNAGSAIAAYAARAGVRCDVYVPDSTSAAKLVQIRTCGATLHRVSGSREDTARAALDAAQSTYYASHSWNPFFLHGTKTFAYEVCEQLGWGAPDTVVLPAGNGTLLLGAAIGFDELCRIGVIDHHPKLVAVQSAACAPLFKAFAAHLSSLPRVDAGPTIAEGIAICEPVRGMQILDAIWKTGGEVIAVEEEAISEALFEMGSHGFFIEPTAAATIAGLKKYLLQAGKDERIVSVFSGHGLKSTKTFMALFGPHGV
jgi:threonine synthase